MCLTTRLGVTSSSEIFNRPVKLLLPSNSHLKILMTLLLRAKNLSHPLSVVLSYLGIYGFLVPTISFNDAYPKYPPLISF
jgi:hypothetical protein